MKIGVFSVLTDQSISPAEFGRAAEDRGLESVFVPEHTHVPADGATPFPLGGEMPPEYGRILDQFVTLTIIAAVTTTLRLATGVCLVLQHDVISLAKRTATLDVISGGRVTLGIGAGWNREELRNHGGDPATRMAAFTERVSAMQLIWARDEASFDGRFTRFGPLQSWPKPVQPGGLPVLVGGSHPAAAPRAMALNAGWMPNLARISDADLAQTLRLAREAGTLPCTAFRVKPRAAAIEHYQTLGIERCVITLPSAGRDETLRRMDECTKLIGLLGDQD